MYSMKDTLADGAKLLGVPISDSQQESLIRYYNILVERNKSVNLTRITEPDEVVTKHFLDSLTPILTKLVSGNVIDVGTGAGFPGLVLKCALPAINLTLLDSLNKRIEFLKDAAAEIGITDGISGGFKSSCEYAYTFRMVLAARKSRRILSRTERSSCRR